jgi:hypothetical protein
MIGQVLRFKATGGVSAREAELQAMVEELVWAMNRWGEDEDDSIHPDAYAAYAEALRVARIPVTTTVQGGETRHRFDPDWCQRQRVTWAMRQQASRP